MTKIEYLKLMAEITKAKLDSAVASMIPRPDNIYYQLSRQYTLELHVYENMLEKTKPPCKTCAGAGGWDVQGYWQTCGACKGKG